MDRTRKIKPKFTVAATENSTEPTKIKIESTPAETQNIKKIQKKENEINEIGNTDHQKPRNSSSKGNSKKAPKPTASAVASYSETWDKIKPSLSSEILKAIKEQGFERTTPVQFATIPQFLKEKDVVVEAVTGSGKTLAFVIPVLEIIKKRTRKNNTKNPKAIIISPTRELAQQIYNVFLKFIELCNYKFTVHLAIGGSQNEVETVEQTAKLRSEGATILVGTPGRLEDITCGRLIGSSAKKVSGNAKKWQSSSGRRSAPVVSCRELEMLIMDEADRLLDMGFEKQIGMILSMLPKQRRTGLFSATMSEAVSELVRTGLRNPSKIVVKVESSDKIGLEQKTPSSLKIYYLVCPPDRKLLQLIRWVESRPNQKFIVYFSTCACVDYFYKVISKYFKPTNDSPQSKASAGDITPSSNMLNVHVASLHGQMDPKRRKLTYDTFTSIPANSTGLLICTDVASRGLDIPDVDCVIQWDPPTDSKVFPHRCGRTARAGRHGSALVFLSPGREETYVEFMGIRKIPMVPSYYLNEELKPYTRGDNGSKEFNKFPEFDQNSDNLIESVRKMVSTDREIYEKGLVAFVSFVRSYQKHEANYIFSIKNLDLHKSAYGYGLLHLPKMPELNGIKNPSFVPYSINLDKIPYTDKKREQQRVLRKKAQAKESLVAGESGTKENSKSSTKQKLESWSQQVEQREKRQARKEKRDKKRDAIQRANEKNIISAIASEQNAGTENIEQIIAEKMLKEKRQAGTISLLDVVKSKPKRQKI